jgi:hypothetical protein
LVQQTLSRDNGVQITAASGLSGNGQE